MRISVGKLFEPSRSNGASYTTVVSHVKRIGTDAENGETS